MKLFAEGRRWKLYQGDAREVLASLPAGSAAALVCDPSYSSGGFTRADRSGDPRKKYAQAGSWEADQVASFSGDSRDQRGFLVWMSIWLVEAVRVVEPGGIVGIFTDWRQLPTVTDAVQAGGVVWRGLGTWVKQTARPQKGRIAAAAEYLVWGSVEGLGQGNGVCAPGAVFAEPVVVAASPRGEEREHLTQKPVEVMAWALSIVREDGLVVDPFVGSGSTGVAALESGRPFVGVDLSEAHLETAARRLAEVEARGQLFAPAATAADQPGLFG